MKTAQEYREAIIDARISLRCQADETALNILDDVLKDSPARKIRSVGDLDPAFRDLIAGEISLGRMREIVNLWLAGMPWRLPSDAPPPDGGAP